MAPESERAKMVDSLEHTRSCPALTPLSDDDCTCGLYWRGLLRTEQEMHAAWRKRAEECELRELTPPATLTCSEVVERPPELCNDHYDCRDCAAYLAWRERRVQEPPILEKFEDEIALHGGFGLTIDQLENLRAALVSAIGKANYPRREQIRKGAKHD